MRPGSHTTAAIAATTSRRSSSANQSDHDDRAQALPHHRVGLHHVEAERTFRPVVDEEAEDQQPSDDQGIEGVEDDQALHDGAGDSEGLSTGAGHHTVSGYIVKRYYTH